MEGRSSRKLHSVDQGRSSTLPGSARFANYKHTANISPPRLVNRWQFRSAKSASPESNMDESRDDENAPLAATLYQQVSE